MQNVKIPQNIQIEDKLLGPFSIRQIAMIGAGLGTSYMLFTSVKKAVGVVPVTAHLYIWIPAVVAIAFAMVKINDISLFRYALLMFEMMVKPRRRLWQPREGIFLNVLTRSALERDEKARAKTKKAGVAEIVEPKSATRLDDLSVLLDREGRVSAERPPVQRVDTVFDGARSIPHP